MIYRLKYAKSESNFDADFEHPTLQGALPIAIIPRALPWAKSFCPFRACCLWSITILGYELLPLHRACCLWSITILG